jgi:hypothetical protein
MPLTLWTLSVPRRGSCVHCGPFAIVGPLSRDGPCDVCQVRFEDGELYEVDEAGEDEWEWEDRALAAASLRARCMASDEWSGGGSAAAGKKRRGRSTRRASKVPRVQHGWMG